MRGCSSKLIEKLGLEAKAMLRLLTRSIPRASTGIRRFQTSSLLRDAPAPDTAKMLSNLDMLALSSTPLNNIESVREDAIKLTSGVLIKSPGKNNEIVGTLLIGSEVFELNLGGGNNTSHFTITNNFLVEFADEALRIFTLVHPKPELIVVGLGKKSRILHERNRKFFNSLGIQIEISNTRTACQNFDLLATERPNQVAGLMLPPNL